MLAFFSYFLSLLNVGQEQPWFPMSGFMNSHSRCPKICKTIVLTLVKKKSTMKEFNEDLKKWPWRCNLNENVIVSTFCLVPYEEAWDKLYSAFCICYFQSPHKFLIYNKGANKNCPNESLFLSSTEFHSIVFCWLQK